MSQHLIGTTKTHFLHSNYPITPDSMGALAVFPRECLVEIFTNLDNASSASASVTNWTCKEIVERHTEFGERKRFLRMVPLLFRLGSHGDLTALTLPHEVPGLSTAMPSWLRSDISTTLTDSRVPTPELTQILTLYPQAQNTGTWFQVDGQKAVVSYGLRTTEGLNLKVILSYEIDMQLPYPHIKPCQHYYKLDVTEKKLQKLAFGNPPQVLKDLDFKQFTKNVELGQFSDTRFFFWVSGFDNEHMDDPLKNFATLQVVNIETLETEKSFNFYPYPETPLPHFVNNIFVDNKFCIVMSDKSCTIKMGKSTIRVDQEILKPFLEMKIREISEITLKNKNNEGLMEVTFKAIKEDGRGVTLSYTTDPSDPLPTRKKEDGIRSCSIL